MDLQQMRYVVAIAETQSFTRAAQRCFVMQSSLSHQVKALERELGVELFARTSRKVEITAAGEAFVTAARACLSAAERAIADATAVVGEVTGTLTIGMIPTTTAINVPAVVKLFCSAHPAVRVRLRTGGSDEFIDAIVAGRMDVAVLGLSESVSPSGVATHELVRERLVAVVGSGHRLAGRKTLRLHDLADESFVDFPEGRPGRVPSDLAFDAAGVDRTVMFEAGSTDVILDIVKQGLAVTLLAREVVPQTDDLRVIPVSDGPVRVEYLAWSDFNPSPAAQAFINIAGVGSA